MGAAGGTRLIALVVACAMFMAQLDGAIVALALPAISRAFAIAPVDLTIGITAYLFAQVILLPTGSWFAERFGARRVFVAAVAVFTTASVLCALSHTLETFTAARILQGCAAALMAPVGRIVLLQSTEKRNLVSVMTISTVPMLVAPSVGPALGGFITTYGSWEWIFLLNVPFGLACIVFALRLIPESTVPQPRPFDVQGFLLFAGSISCILYSLQRLGDDYPHWLTPGLLMLGGLAIGAAAVRHSLRHPHPIISLGAIAIPTFRIAALRGGALLRLPIRALPFLLPMMFQLTLGMSAVRAGILMLALNGGDLVLKLITTRTLQRFGFRSVLLVTATLSCVSLAACASFSATTPFAVILLVLLGSGMFRSLLFTGISTLVFADVPRSELSSASTLWNIVQQATNELGVSVSAILLAGAAQFAGEPRDQLSVHDFRVALLSMAAIAAFSLLSLRRLAHDAGASVSGHVQQTAPQESG